MEKQIEKERHVSSLKIFIVLAIGVLGVSTAAIFVRLCTNATENRTLGFSFFLAAGRLFLSSILMIPAWKGFCAVQKKRKKGAIAYASLAGVCLSVHFSTWFFSLSYTSIAASTTLVTTTPIWIALLSWCFFSEKPTRLTFLGIFIAILGGIFIGLDSPSQEGTGHNAFLGNTFALLGAWAYSFYFLAGREAQKRGLGTGHYAAVAYTASALVLLPLPWCFNTAYWGYPVEVYGYLLLMALLAQVIGQTCLNWAVCWISPVLVTLAVMFEPLFSSLFAYPLFHEVPGPLLLMGAVILLVGVGFATYGSKSPVPQKQAENI